MIIFFLPVIARSATTWQSVYLINTNRKITMKLWPYVLGAWLVLTGLNSVISLNFQYEKLVLGVLALVAGVLVILRK